jgi:hypothetical protein
MSETIANRIYSHIEKLYLKINDLEQQLIFLKFDNAWLKSNLEYEIKTRKLMENKWFKW